jgi:phage RecT family recombinase
MSTNLEKAQNATANEKVTDLVARKDVADKFMSIYQAMHNNKDANRFYEIEKFHFSKLISENQALQKCDKLSLYGCFMDQAIDGLSFDPGMKHVYIVPKSKNIGTKENKKYITVAQRMVTGLGELILRQRTGQIKHADNPVLVYQGDTFKFGTRNGQFFIEHEVSLPRKSDHAIACYLRIERNDGTIDYKVLTRDELEALRKKSDNPNGPAWSGSYNGMFVAKTIKHAFKNYPKLRVGNYSAVETTVESDPSAPIPPDAYVMPTDPSDQTPIQEAVVINDSAPLEAPVEQAPPTELFPKQEGGAF